MVNNNNHPPKGKAAFEPVAIIGMRGRFPGADTLDQFWQNLATGVESISTLSPEEMRASGVPDHVIRLPGYVNAAPVLEAIDEFDAEFFGFSARDASLTDPQQRLFIETAWQALEDAGYDPERYPGAIGVFGGCELSSYLYLLYKNMDSLGYLDGMQLMITNEKDYLCTQVSYRLNLTGPSIAVQTSCSTSLVAVSLACESLHAGRCDMALAGGVTIRVPQKGGYFYTAGSILSPDGHCRPFDANAQGTIIGGGVGLVVLKRLEDALADRDNIRAVILGIGLNNDGNDKVGYTAPSFRGQVEAIRMAQEAAGVPAESIGYVEAHGTGTILGDPIELSALTEVFSSQTEKRGFCGIGSVKSNFGHLSCAAGAAGLIKTVLAMENGAIPPTVHYKTPNPAFDISASPFYVTTELQPWEMNGSPRRAGVSSFGVGGTNAHIVIEQPAEQPKPSERRPHQLILLSARSQEALDAASVRLADHLQAHPELDLADVASTLHLGRRFFQYRRTLVSGSNDKPGLIAALNDPESNPSVTTAAERPVVFMFPGQGSQYPGMTAGLYRSEPIVKQTIDYCAKRLTPHLGMDLRKILFPTKRKKKAAVETLKDTRFAQPAIFTVEYAVTELWRSWGIRPSAMVGHSIGEYVAATLSGVLELDDALQLIARRGELISDLPRGSMLAVMAPVGDVQRFVGDDVSLAAVNAPGFSVLSGPHEAIDQVASALDGESIAARRLHTSHAFHSSMMEPILGEFEELIAGFKLSKPTIPFVTTLTGEWADGPVTQPAYWSAQLRSTVRFADALDVLVNEDSPVGNDAILLEAGPGRTLTTFAASAVNGLEQKPLFLAPLPGANDRRTDTEMMLTTLGQLWAAGVEVDWEGFHNTERRVRVSLPTYPFERRSFWVGERAEDIISNAQESRDTSDWFYKPVWQPAALNREVDDKLNSRRILIFDEQTGLGAAVIEHLREAGGHPLVVRKGDTFQNSIGEDEFLLDPSNPNGYQQLAAQICNEENLLAGVIDCWSAGPPDDTDLETAALDTLLNPMRLAHALSSRTTVRPLPILLTARGSTRVLDDDVLDPNRALGIGPAKVLPQEHPGLRLAHIDVDGDQSVAELLLAELAAGIPEPALALRSGGRYIETYEPLPIDNAGPPLGLPENPVVMITGGMGYMGLQLAEGLFQHMKARLILISRTKMPQPAQWAALGEDQTVEPKLRQNLKRLAEMHEQRNDVLVLAADLNDPRQVNTAVDEAIAHFGKIDLVVHGAARVDAAAFGSAAETGPEIVEAQFAPKLYGLNYLIEAFRDREPRRWVLHSSISTVLGGLGLAAYGASNAVLDSIAQARGDNWLSLDWDAWDNAAEAQNVSMPTAIRPLEGQDAFLRSLSVDPGSRLIVVVDELEDRIKAWIRHDDDEAANAGVVERHPRPNLTTAFVEPRTDTEVILADIWGVQLGVESIGIHDGFFDLGGHSLLAVQVASQIRDQFQIEMPVLKLFQAPTVAELAILVDEALTSGNSDSKPSGLPFPKSSSPAAPPPAPVPALEEDTPGAATKASYRDFYNDVTRRLEQSGVGESSFFLNYGYISLNKDDEAQFDVPDDTLNGSSVRLALELIGAADLKGKQVLDVGCGRGGTVALMAELFQVRIPVKTITFSGRCRSLRPGDADHSFRLMAITPERDNTGSKIIPLVVACDQRRMNFSHRLSFQF